MTLTLVEQKAEQAITLTPLVDPEGQTEARLPITWCLSERARSLLESYHPDYPHLLIVAMRHDVEKGEWVELSRDLVPLDDGFFTVQFQHGGTNVLKAVVVWPGKDRAVYQMKSSLIGFNREGKPKSTLFSSRNGRLFDTFPTDHRLSCKAGELAVSVDPDLVNTSPSRIGMALAWPANFFLRKKPRDQCRLRARILFSLPLWPITAALAVIVAGLVTVCALVYVAICLFLLIQTLLAGRRNIRLRSFTTRPLDPRDIYRYAGPSVWRKKKIGPDEYMPRSPFLTLVNPFSLELAAFGGVFVGFVLTKELHWALGLYAIAAMVAGGALVALTPNRLNETDEEHRLRKEREKKEDEEWYQDWIASMACESRLTTATQAYEERSVVLRKRDKLKGKVCSPYSAQ